MIETKFIVSKSPGVYGRGLELITEDHIIIIKQNTIKLNLDYDQRIETKTNTKYLNKPIYRRTISKTGLELLQAGNDKAPFVLNHGFSIEQYILTNVRIKSRNQSKNGGFISIDTAFGKEVTTYNRNSIEFNVNPEDKIIDTENQYIFEIEWLRSINVSNDNELENEKVEKKNSLLNRIQRIRKK